MKNQKGFTLIEIMVVVIILGLLAGLVLPKFLGQEEKAKVEVAKTQIRSLEERAWTRSSSTTVSTPPRTRARRADQKARVGRIPDKWREGGYLKPARIPKDPWGKDYVYLRAGQRRQGV